MPTSKRDKKISLTKTDKKGLALKQKIINDVRACVDKFGSVYVFTYTNMRNEKMKEVREEWKPSRFFFGKNRVIAIGLGRTIEEEVQDELHKLTHCLKGQCALLFTQKSEEEVSEWFENFSYEDYARAGFQVKDTISLKKGPLKQFAHAMEPYLRQLGLPTQLQKGVVTLIKNYEVCKAGTTLTPEQAKILELLEYKLATFTLNLQACWIKGSGFKKLVKEVEESEENEVEEMDDD